MPMKAVGPRENANPEVGQLVVWQGSNSRYYVAKVLRQIGMGNYLVKDCEDGSECEVYDEKIIAKEVDAPKEPAIGTQARMNELSVDLRRRKKRAQDAFLLESEDPTEHIRFSDFETWLVARAEMGCGDADELLGLRQQMEQERTAITECLVHGCENRSDQGVFRNDLCLSCHTAITTGRAGHGNGFIGKLQRDNEKLVRVEQERTASTKGPGPVQWHRIETAEELLHHLAAPSKMETALKLIAELTHPVNCDPSKELLHYLATTALENTK